MTTEMNKTLKYALSAVLSAAIITPVLAQDNFPDVPDNHWAYEALSRMKKDGLLVGYPDGLFRGNRPASRYELAVAVHATYVHLKSITDGLQSEIDELKNRPQVDIQPLKDAIQALQDEVNNMKGWGADIDNLKKLADQFQKELASLGVDVESLKKDLADLAKRVGVLEAHRLPIDIHGDANMLLMSGSSSSHRPGIAVDGRPVGVRIPGGGFGGGWNVAGGDVDSAIFHELALRLSSNNDTGPKWHGTLVIGNMLGSDFSSSSIFSSGFKNAGSGFSQSSTGVGPRGTGFEMVGLQDLAVDFDTSIVGQGLNAELGRTSYSIDPYIFQRPATNPYFQNDRWDNGKWTFDGGILGFHWSSVKLDVFGGKQDQDTTTGSFFQTMTAGAIGHPYTPGGPRPVGLLSNGNPNLLGGNPLSSGIPVNEDLGLNLGVPLGQNGKLDLAYIWFESNQGITATGGLPGPTAARIANKANVFGGDLKWNFGQIVFDGGYSQSNVMLNNHSVSNKDNSAWHGQLAYDASRWGLQAGYRDIQPQFGAPGDWGRIGIWWNPTDIKGPEVSAHLNLTDSLKLTAGGEWYTGHNETLSDGTGLGTHDHLDHYTAELGYKLNEAWNVSLGAELVNWRLANRTGLPGANPTERWYNVGLGYNLSDQARLSFLYQWSDYDGKGYPGFAPFAYPSKSGWSGDRLTGGLLTTQLTVKF